ncbi:MAG TPA: hypothetical protein VFQ60_03405 [Patescibacteria group bacterium]|nr:hypothetical protein [Patescibacteria group bacterium]
MRYWLWYLLTFHWLVKICRSLTNKPKPRRAPDEHVYRKPVFPKEPPKPTWRERFSLWQKRHTYEIRGFKTLSHVFGILLALTALLLFLFVPHAVNAKIIQVSWTCSWNVVGVNPYDHYERPHLVISVNQGKDVKVECSRPTKIILPISESEETYRLRKNFSCCAMVINNGKEKRVCTEHEDACAYFLTYPNAAISVDRVGDMRIGPY